MIIAKSTLKGILKATTNVGLTSFKNNARTIIARIAPKRILDKILLTIMSMYSP